MADTPDTDSEEIRPFEETAQVENPAEQDELRRTLADVYTFVRSAEMNKTVSSFTLDHYIDEAKRRIKEDRVLRSASDPGKGVGTRSAQLTSLEKLEETFNKSFEKMAALATKADKDTQDEEAGQ